MSSARPRCAWRPTRGWGWWWPSSSRGTTSRSISRGNTGGRRSSLLRRVATSSLSSVFFVIQISTSTPGTFAPPIKKSQLNHDHFRNAPGGATALMGASRRGHSRVVELLLQHPDTDTDILDRDGQTALQHARTNSVKWRLHNYSYRSRSVDNVMGSQRYNYFYIVNRLLLIQFPIKYYKC